MEPSYRIDLPNKGDKLQIHVQGVSIVARGDGKYELGELGPLHSLVCEIDLYDALKQCCEDENILYLNAFISVKKKNPEPVEIHGVIEEYIPCDCCDEGPIPKAVTKKAMELFDNYFNAITLLSGIKNVPDGAFFTKTKVGYNEGI